MKIISKFKDYYDHMLNKYGIDPKIIFVRTKLKKTIVSRQLNINFDQKYYPNHERLEDNQYTFKILVVCGKYFVIKARRDKDSRISNYSLVTRKDLDDPKVYSDVKNVIYYNSGSFFIRMKTKKEKNLDLLYQKELCGVYSQEMVEISKEINCPIFIIDSYAKYVYEVRLNPNIPNLSKIKGIQSLLPPETLFNDIAFFIGNVLNNNPDDKMVVVSNKDKIIKGGFDLKTSFRNM